MAKGQRQAKFYKKRLNFTRTYRELHSFINLKKAKFYQEKTSFK